MKAHPTLKRNLANRIASHRKWSTGWVASAIMLSCSAGRFQGRSHIESDTIANPSVEGVMKPVTPAPVLTKLKLNFEEVQAVRDRLENGAFDNKPPKGIKPEEVAEPLRVIESLDLCYQEGINSQSAKPSEQEKLKLAEAAASLCKGLPEPPPYSMLMLYGWKRKPTPVSLRSKVEFFGGVALPVRAK